LVGVQSQDSMTRGPKTEVSVLGEV